MDELLKEVLDAVSTLAYETELFKPPQNLKPGMYFIDFCGILRHVETYIDTPWVYSGFDDCGYAVPGIPASAFDLDSIRALRPIHLVLKRKWFELIEDGYKREEYRDRTDYWFRRLHTKSGVAREFDIAIFQHGYATDAPRIITSLRGQAYIGKPMWEWAEMESWERKCWILPLGELQQVGKMWIESRKLITDGK